MKKLLLLCLCLLGCTGVRKEVFPTPEEEIVGLAYVRDERTGLCFLVDDVIDGAFHEDVFVNVPCTPEVEKLIAERRRGKATK